MLSRPCAGVLLTRKASLSQGGKWRTGNETYQCENEVAWNRFTHWMETLCDSGATYFLGPQKGSSHHHNHCVQGGSGIEPDSGHSTSAHVG